MLWIALNEHVLLGLKNGVEPSTIHLLNVHVEYKRADTLTAFPADWYTAWIDNMWHEMHLSHSSLLSRWGTTVVLWIYQLTTYRYMARVSFQE